MTGPISKKGTNYLEYVITGIIIQLWLRIKCRRLLWKWSFSDLLISTTIRSAIVLISVQENTRSDFPALLKYLTINLGCKLICRISAKTFLLVMISQNKCLELYATRHLTIKPNLQFCITWNLTMYPSSKVSW